MSLVRVARGSSRGAGFMMMLLLVSCGGGGDGSEGTSPTLSPTRTPTATLTSSQLPSPTRSPGLTDGTGLPSATQTPDQSEGAEPPGPTLSTDQGETADEPESQPSQEPSGEESTTQTPADEPGAESADDDGVLPTVWWLVAALVIGSAVAVPLTMRARRRRAWQQDLVDAEAELAWLAHELLPGLRQTGSIEMVAGGWVVGQARVTAAEDGLTVLESAAADQVGRERARSLRDATRQARVRMERLAAPERSGRWEPELDEIISDLDAALRPSHPSRPSPSSPA